MRHVTRAGSRAGQSAYDGGVIIHLARHWWLLLLRGIAAFTFGAVALAWPDITVSALVLVFGAYALIDGAMSLLAFLRADPLAPRPWTLALEGLVGFAVAMIAVFWPEITAVALVWLVAFWAGLTGLVELLVAWAIRRAGMGGGIWMALVGIVSISLAIALAVYPKEGELVLVWAIGAAAIFAGLFLIALGLAARRSDTLVVLDDASLVKVPDTPAELDRYHDFTEHDDL